MARSRAFCRQPQATLTATRSDLVVSEVRRELVATGTSQTLDLNQSGSVSVFFDVSHRTRRLSLSLAKSSLSGDFEFDSLGVLSTTPGFDLDGDRIDDLVIGAARADVTTTDIHPAAGKIFMIYGSAARKSLPPNAIVLGNRSFTGSGFFLVDEGTGRPTVFQDAPGETKPLFVLNNGADAWYKFTTLADGMPGNAITVLPQTLDSFLTPISAASSPSLSAGSGSIGVDKNQSVGNTLVAQPNVDGASGSVFVAEQFTTTGRVTGWSVYGGVFSGTRHVTPLILKATVAGRYEITGICKAQEIVKDRPQEFAFDLVSGSDSAGPSYYLGWYDGSATADNQGSIGFVQLIQPAAPSLV